MLFWLIQDGFLSTFIKNSQYCKHLDGNLSFLKTQLLLIKSGVGGVVIIIIITGLSEKKKRRVWTQCMGQL